jgi:hypothetical protein
MEIKMNSSYAVLYDRAVILKTTPEERAEMDEAARKDFIANINKSLDDAKELKKLLETSYGMHSNRNISDAITTISETIKSISIFKSSLQ